MTDLEQAVRDASSKLRGIHGLVSRANGRTTILPEKCYTHWEDISILYHDLNKSISLLNFRSAAWAALSSVANDNNRSVDVSNSVKYMGVTTEFPIARHLCLAGYLSISWSVYDVLTNVIARMLGDESVAKNKNSRSNYKLVDAFLRDNDKHSKVKLLGYSFSALTPKLFAWPVSVSYEIRNWVIHEGFSSERTTAFVSDTVEDRPFRLDSTATERITNKCGEFGITDQQSRLSTSPGYPWYDNDILKILETYDAETDALITMLLNWSVESFEKLVREFSACDAHNLR